MTPFIQTYLNTWKEKAIIFVVVFITFGGSLINQYALDDQFVTTSENDQVMKGIKGIPDILTTHYSQAKNVNYGYRPLAEISFAIEYEIFGMTPFWSHSINLLLYGCLILLLLSNLKILFPENQTAIFILILLFTVHPLHSEVVFSLKNREEILAILFGLWALTYAFKCIEKQNKIDFTLMIMLFLLACFSKKTAYPFAFFIPICIVYFDHKKWKSALKIFFSLAITTQITSNLPILFLGKHIGRPIDFIENPLAAEDMLNRIVPSLLVFVYYLKLMLYPKPLLSYYGYNQLALTNPTSEDFITTFLILLVFLFTLCYGLLKQKKWGFGLLIISVFLMPYINLIYPITGIVAERFAFFPIIGGLLYVYFLIKDFLLIKWVKYLLVGFVFCWAIWSISININRAKDWYNLETLLKADVNKAPKSVKLNNAYAEHMHTQLSFKSKAQPKEYYFKEAQKHYKQSHRLMPKEAMILNNLGLLFLESQQIDSSQFYLEQAIAIDSKKAEIHFNLGAIYEFQKETKKAKMAYLKALQINPEYYQARERLNLLN